MKIYIPEPCHENWQAMLPAEKGAFCQACSKTVVDFTTMPDEEVKNYLTGHLGQETCGRFRNDQLHHQPDELSGILSLQIPVWKKIVAAVFILFGSLLTSCGDKTMGKVTTLVPVIEKIRFMKTPASLLFRLIQL